MRKRKFVDTVWKPIKSLVDVGNNGLFCKKIKQGTLNAKNVRIINETKDTSSVHKISIVGIEEATQKASEYVDKLKEAKTLADELASVDFSVSLLSQNLSSDHKSK